MTPWGRLLAAWARLDAVGAVVRRVDLRGRTSSELGALAEDAEHRLAAIAEGTAAGWRPT